MKNQLLKLTTILFALLFLHNTINAQLPVSLQTKLQDTLTHIGNRFKFKGLSVAVSYKNSGIWASAFGNSTATQPLTSDMLIGIGSNTKTFVSTIMVKLHENGQLSLDDSIGTWIQGYNNISGSITIRQLLNHTSGLNSYTGNPTFWNDVNTNMSKVWTKQEILTSYINAPSFSPGTSFEYSNTNYILAGLIEEIVTGEPVHSLIRDSILTPNNLNHTFFPPYETVTDTYANFWTDLDGIGAYDDMGNWANANALVPKEIQSIANSAGGLVSTATDNVLFWKALMNGQIINKSSLQNEMMSQWKVMQNSPLVHYSLGIMKAKLYGNAAFSHGGTWLGQINSNLIDTGNNIYVTVLSNQDSLQNGYTQLVVNALYKVCLDYNQNVGVRDYIQDNNLQIFPNPATDILNIKSNGDQYISEAILYNQLGKIVRHKKGLNHSKTNQLDISALNQGIYFIRVVRQDGTIINNKIIKK